MNRIQKNLEKIFQKERIVFWYDEKAEMREVVQNLELADVSVVEVRNNEFSLKYRIVKQDPDSKFLLYFPCRRSEDSENWLLDLLLANVEFSADESSVLMQEVGLPAGLRPVVEEHRPFFKSTARTDALKKLIEKDENPRSLRIKMLSIACGSGPKMEEITLRLVGEHARGKGESFSKIKSFGLEPFFWSEMKNGFGYRSEFPSMIDFIYSLFATGYRSVMGGDMPLSGEGLIFLNRWKDSTSSIESFKEMSGRVAESLNIVEELDQEPLEKLIDLDIYEVVDRRIIVNLIRDILSDSISHKKVEEIIDARRKSLWYSKNEDYFLCVGVSSEFFERMKDLDLRSGHSQEAFRKYEGSLFRIDQLYRQFVRSFHATGPDSLLMELYERVHGHYSNNFLLTLNDRWQKHVNDMDAWNIEGIPGQETFYSRYVKPYPEQGKKIFVVISDALRYEAAEELKGKILRLDRYQAEIESMLGVLPSYTQLGMAALLPHGRISFAKDLSSVTIDGRSTQRLSARNNILKDIPSVKAIAMSADEFLGLDAHTEGRQVAKEHDVIYIFHNGIDEAGDSRDSEGRVFEAVEEEFDILLNIIRKIVNVNGNNILITSDHGFIYQDKEIDESDFAMYEIPDGATVISRRYIVGRDLQSQPAFKKFTSEQLGIEGTSEVLIPKSINRLRVKGAGSRYVHGGASLQEIVIPVLAVTKLRSSDVRFVEVDVLTSSRINSRQPVFRLFQTEPVEEKVQPRSLRIGVFSADDILLSEICKEIFDSSDENGRAREKKIALRLSREADRFNGQRVFLKLEEPAAPGVSQYKTYKSLALNLNLPFEGDFEDF